MIKVLFTALICAFLFLTGCGEDESSVTATEIFDGNSSVSEDVISDSAEEIFIENSINYTIGDYDKLSFPTTNYWGANVLIEYFVSL